MKTKINQINGLNRKARTYLLDHCVSRRGAEVVAYGFTGYLNGDWVDDAILIRRSSKWYNFNSNERVFSLKGELENGFSMTRNTI